MIRNAKGLLKKDRERKKTIDDVHILLILWPQIIGGGRFLDSLAKKGNDVKACFFQTCTSTKIKGVWKWRCGVLLTVLATFQRIALVALYAAVSWAHVDHQAPGLSRPYKYRLADSYNFSCLSHVDHGTFPMISCSTSHHIRCRFASLCFACELLDNKHYMHY